MKLQIAFHQVPQVPALEDYVQRRLNQLARHFDDPDAECHVVFESPTSEEKKRGAVANVRLNLPGTFLVVSKKGKDAFEAFDVAEKALEKAIERWKDGQVIGARHPTKYFVAKQLEQGNLPATVQRGPDGVFASEPARDTIDEDLPSYQGALEDPR